MNYAYLGLLLICWAYALWAGGGPERIGVTAYTLSCFVTLAVLSAAPFSWRSPELGVFIVDVVMFFAFCILAIRADRFWPIWVSGLLGLGVLGHLARWAGPGVIPWAYRVVLTVWSYPILAIFAIGTFNHQRRLARNGADPSWSTSSIHSPQG